MNTIYDEILADVITNYFPETCKTTLVVGATPPENSVSVAWTGGNETRYMHSTKFKSDMTIVVNAKNESQLAALQILGRIHQALTSVRRFPNNEKYRIFSIMTQNAPAFAGREESGQWVYVSSLLIRFATNKE
ncbi:MAG: minor capsid protein [Clostridia bacterium]|nr:minor capsid protein [Clostridia bacterium]